MTPNELLDSIEREIRVRVREESCVGRAILRRTSTRSESDVRCDVLNAMLEILEDHRELEKS